MNTQKVKLGFSALVGTALLIIVEFAQKGDNSALNSIQNNIACFFNVECNSILSIITILLIIIIGTSLCFIFEADSMKKAFYYGASVIAIGTTFIPTQTYDNLKAYPNSVLVKVHLQFENNQPINDVIVTLWSINQNRIVAKSRFNDRNFSFYQDEGNYRIQIEVPGYSICNRQFQVIEGNPPVILNITMTPTNMPLFLQRMIK